MASAPRTIIKQGKNFKAYSDGSIVVMNVRTSYPRLFVAQEGTTGDGPNRKPNGVFKFSCTGLAPKNTHGEFITYMNGLFKQIANEHKPASWPKDRDYKVPPENKFVRNGDDGSKIETEGYYVISASEQTRPMVMDEAGVELLHTSRDDVAQIVGGETWGDLMIKPWWQNKNAERNQPERINAGLLGFRKRAVPAGQVSEAFGTGTIAAEDRRASLADDHDTMGEGAGDYDVDDL